MSTEREPKEFIPERTSIEGMNSLRSAERVGFNLYREAAILVTLVAHSYFGVPEEFPYSRDQAVGAGLLLRMSKFMRLVTQFASERTEGEIVPALNRCILESAMNLEYLILKDDPDTYSSFVAQSLGPEKELFELIQKNTAERGGERLPIEIRMIESIRRTCLASGKSIEELSAKRGQWGTNFRERLRAIGKEDLYLTVQKLGSHAIHGTWPDLVLNYLEQDEFSGKYRPRQSKRVDARILTPVAYLVLDSVRVYVRKSSDLSAEAIPIADALDDLLERLEKFEVVHEQLLSM